MPKLEVNTAELAVVLGRGKPQDAPGVAVGCAMNIAAYGRRMGKRNVARCNVQDYDMAHAARLDAQDMRMVEDLLRPYREPANAPAFYASILAKEHRDRLMRAAAAEFPHYGWERNAGYGTAEHLAALRQHGASPHHRRSFAPVAAVIG